MVQDKLGKDASFMHSFNIFLERIMSDVIEEHDWTATKGDRTITSLRYAGDIDGLDEEKQEL